MVGDSGSVDMVLGLEELFHHIDRDVEREVPPAVSGIDAERLEPRESKVDLLLGRFKHSERLGRKVLTIVQALKIADIRKLGEKIVEVRELEADRDRYIGGPGSNTEVDVVWWDRVKLWTRNELPTLNENQVKAGTVLNVSLLV